jgi:hypothetical protein
MAIPVINAVMISARVLTVLDDIGTTPMSDRPQIVVVGQ